MKVYQITEILEKIAPLEIAEEWDNVGLIIGDKSKEVKKLLVALDINAEILKQAVDLGVDMIVVHHPLIFKPINRINDSILLSLIQNNIAVYASHTNLDNSELGVNSVLADVLSLKNVSREGMLAIGEINETSAFDFIAFVKKQLKVEAVRASNYELNKKIKKVAVLGGSGGDFVQQVANLKCDAFVTGEASYHDAQLAYENDLLLIAAGHFETENPVVDMLTQYLTDNTDAEVVKAQPFNVYISI